ncbi:MAG: Rrf2 family transcriptional regulator [Eggerthellaceae bacterium]|nr:Rrf2 family transcriptional regulator [Eggerthellaceae bacterium]
MQLKASTDYGLRAVLYLAEQDSTCSSKDIAHDMSIPRDYLIQLAQLLRNAGIIEARPGKHGGYRLAKDPSEITLLQVISAIDDDAKDTTRARREDRKNAAMVDDVKRAYELVMDSYDAYLDSITLDMLLDCAKDSHKGREYLAERLSDESKRLLVPKGEEHVA